MPFLQASLLHFSGESSAVVKRNVSAQEVWGSIPALVKSAQCRQVVNGSPPLRSFFGAVLPRRLAAEMRFATHLTPRRNNASIIKI